MEYLVTNTLNHASVIELARRRFARIVEKAKLHREEIIIRMRPLKPHEAIGYPIRNDYPLLQGKEVMVEASFMGEKGQAFTDEPSNFSGTITDILELDLSVSRNRAVFISSLNAVMRYLNMTYGTVHCKDSEPEECAKMVAERVEKIVGKAGTVGIIGLQPSISEEIIKRLSPSRVRIADLDRKNVGRFFCGVKVEDGSIAQEDIASSSSLCLATGSTVVNGTIDHIIKSARGKLVFYGVTISGISSLLGFERFCFMSH